MVRKRMEEVEASDKVRNWQPPISGDLIMRTFGIRPGREVGIIKDHIRESILDGVISGSYEAAYQLMLSKGEEIGLLPANQNQEKTDTP